jgi:hypothetical protein
MSKSDSLENSFLKLIFNATAFANIADNAATSPLTNLYVSLHTADPGEAGTQATNEVTVGQHNTYARIAVLRTTGGWTVTANSVSPVAAVAFALGVSGTGATASHFGVGTSATGAGVLLWSGTITPNIPVGAGITPSITTASTITED